MINTQNITSKTTYGTNSILVEVRNHWEMLPPLSFSMYFYFRFLANDIWVVYWRFQAYGRDGEMHQFKLDGMDVRSDVPTNQHAKEKLTFYIHHMTGDELLK